MKYEEVEKEGLDSSKEKKELPVPPWSKYSKTFATFILENLEIRIMQPTVLHNTRRLISDQPRAELRR